MSSPMGGAGPARSFQSRLNRVADARGPHDGASTKVSVLPNWKRDLLRKFSLPLAILAGALAVLAVRLGQFHINGVALVSNSPEMTMSIEAGVAVLLSVIVLLLMPFTSVLVKLGYLIGLALGLVAMHNAVHAAPGLFSLGFSPAWTTEVLAATEPNTLYVLGQSIDVIPEMPEKEPEPIKPTILRLN